MKKGFDFTFSKWISSCSYAISRIDFLVLIKLKCLAAFIKNKLHVDLNCYDERTAV